MYESETSVDTGNSRHRERISDVFTRYDVTCSGKCSLRERERERERGRERDGDRGRERE